MGCITKLATNYYEEVKMELTKYEKETIILFNEEETEASIYTHNKRLLSRLAGFDEKSDDCYLEKSGDGFAEYKVPKTWIKINMPRQYSKEQRQKMAERARANLVFVNKGGNMVEVE